MANVLIIDDEESICWGLGRLCEQMGVESRSASSAEKGLELAAEIAFDVVILDVRLPGMDGLAAIERFHQRLGRVPVIMITAFGDLQTAITAVQRGAFEYIVKPFSLEQVRTTLRQALATRQMLESMEGQDRAIDDEPRRSTAGLIGSSAVMQSVYKQVALATTQEAPVLITGESGTGKELTARSIHRFGSRAEGPFVAVNIAALSPTLAESELFGHVKGAFTGADADRRGLIQQASGGTLFLDEVAEIPLEIQVKLLRVLDQNEVTPVGSNQPVATDFRLISATHQDLLALVNRGDFRHDLFYRLRTFEIRLPPLRERPADIPELVRHFMSQGGGQMPVSVSPEFLEALEAREWPGNVRELQSVVARATALARGGVITPDHLEAAPEPSVLPSGDLQAELLRCIGEWTRQNWRRESEGPLYDRLLQLMESALLPAAFELSDRQYSAAARRLGIHRTTLKKKLEEREP